MRVVAALGGNALLRRGERLSHANQQANLQVAIGPLASIVDKHELIITHGNGPQVGLLAHQQAIQEAGNNFPLDVLDAETEGMIGYMIAQELSNQASGEVQIATLLTRTEISLDDPAFAKPSKPVGPIVSAEAASKLHQDHGWVFGQEEKGHRRLVPSPAPHKIIECDIISCLVERGIVVICAGGGGIPVNRDENGHLNGVEAVVDKDRVSALLAEQLGVDRLLLLTDVHAVYDGWGTAEARALAEVHVSQLQAQQFPPGSMGPKVEAACQFVTATKKRAIIGHISEAVAMLAAKSGTVINP